MKPLPFYVNNTDKTTLVGVSESANTHCISKTFCISASTWENWQKKKILHMS